MNTSYTILTFGAICLTLTNNNKKTTFTMLKVNFPVHSAVVAKGTHSQEQLL